MKTRSYPMLCALAIAGGLMAVGCSANGSSDGSSSSVTGTGSQAQATVVRGTFLSRIDGGNQVQPSAGVKVSVVGTRQAAVSDAKGHFTFGAAPVGMAQIQFESQAGRSSVNVETTQNQE